MSESINIPAVPASYAEFTIEGLTPLLHNKMSDKDKQSIVKKKFGIPVEKEITEDEVVYLSRIHLMSDNKPGHPSTGITKSLVEVCRLEKEPMTKAQRALSVMPTDNGLVPIHCPKGHHMFKTWAISSNGKNSAAVQTIRAMFPLPWEMTFTVRYNPTVFPIERVAYLINLAGAYEGIGSWRPSCNGPYGTFRIKEDS